MNEKELRLDMKVDKRLALRIASGVMSMAIVGTMAFVLSDVFYSAHETEVLGSASASDAIVDEQANIRYGTGDSVRYFVNGESSDDTGYVVDEVHVDGNASYRNYYVDSYFSKEANINAISDFLSVSDGSEVVCENGRLTSIFLKSDVDIDGFRNLLSDMYDDIDITLSDDSTFASDIMVYIEGDMGSCSILEFIQNI